MPDEWMPYFCESMTEFWSKDAKITACTVLLINLDEIKKVKSDKEQDQLKSLITMIYYRERLPFRRNPETLYRHASFCATANDPHIITDMFNSRRHLIIPVKFIDYLSPVDHDKLLADLCDLYLSGFQYYFDADEMEEVMETNDRRRKRRPKRSCSTPT